MSMYPNPFVFTMHASVIADTSLIKLVGGKDYAKFKDVATKLFVQVR